MLISPPILYDITDGTFRKEKYTQSDQKIFNTVLEDVALQCNEKHDPYKRQASTSANCYSPDQRNMAIYVYLKDLNKIELKNLFVYLNSYISKNKNELSSTNVDNLLYLLIHSVKVLNTQIAKNNALNDNDITVTTNVINSLSTLLSIKNITDYKIPSLYQIRENNSFTITTSKELITIDPLISDIIQLSSDLVNRLNTQKDTYKIESLNDFLESLGQFGFELKLKNEFQDLHHTFPEMALKIIKLNNSSVKSKGSSAYVFLNKYDDGNEAQIQSDCQELFKLKNCSRPMTEDFLLFQTIARGDYHNSSYPLADFECVEKQILQNIDKISSREQIHIFNFLKNILKVNDLSTSDFKILFGIASNSIHQLNDKLQKRTFGNDFLKITQNLSLFLINILKSNTRNKDLHDQNHIINQFSGLYKNTILYAPGLKRLINEMTNDLFKILFLNADNDANIDMGYNTLVTTINDVNQICIENTNACNPLKVLSFSLKSFAKIYRKHRTSHESKAIADAKALIKLMGDKLSSDEIIKAVSFFFKEDIKQSELNKKCKELFNLTNCLPSNALNLTIQSKNDYLNDEPVITIMPKNSTSAENDTLSTPIFAASVTGNELEKTSDMPIQFYNTTHSENATALNNSNVNQETSYIIPSGTELIASGAYGAASGAINGITQYFDNKALQNEQPTKRSVIIVSGVIAQTTLATLYPLMLFTVQNHLAHENEEDENPLQSPYNDMLYTFISSLGLNLGLQLFNRCMPQLSNQRLTRSILQNTIPVLGTAINAVKNPLSTAIHLGTSIASSALTYSLFNRISPLKKIRHQDVETNATEMEQLNLKKEPIPINGTFVKGTETLAKTYQYITEDKFNDIKSHSNEVSNQLKTLINSLNEDIEKIRIKIESDTIPTVAETYQKIIDDKSHVLKKLQEGLEKYDQDVNLLNDDHQNAYKKHLIETTYTSEQKNKVKANYTSAMEKLGNVFKRMERMLNELEHDLHEVGGYAKAASNSFYGNDQTIACLNKIIVQIQFLLSPTKNYLNLYCTSQAAEQGEKRGAKKALNNQQSFLQLENNRKASLRAQRTRQFFDTRCQSDSAKTHSSGSDEGSVISTGSSKDNENDQIIRPLLN